MSSEAVGRYFRPFMAFPRLPIFFPTSLSGVLVFGSVSRPASFQPPPPRGFFLSHTTLSYTTLSHTSLSLTHTRNLSHDFVTHNFVTHTQLFHTYLSHTTLSNTRNSFTQISPTQLFHTSHDFLNFRSSTISFVFPAFSVPLQALFLIIGRNCDLWGYPVL